MYVVGPGNSRGVSVALPSSTFPSRFRHVSSERGRPSKSETKTVLAQWLRPRLVTCGLGFDPGGRRSQARPPICRQQRRVWASDATRVQGSH